MLIGSLPPATSLSTWSESLELRDVEDDSLIDLSTVTEVTLTLHDPLYSIDELTLKKSTGKITFPSAGIIQWRAEKSEMESLTDRTYEVRMTIESEGDTIALFLGTIAILD